VTREAFWMLVLLVAAVVLLVRHTCALARMDRRTPHPVRVAMVLTSVGSCGVLLSLVADSTLRTPGVAAIVAGAAVLSIFGRRGGGG